eukprot:13975311-Alexandrium_andersonii.AAC.1
MRKQRSFSSPKRSGRCLSAAPGNSYPVAHLPLMAVAWPSGLSGAKGLLSSPDGPARTGRRVDCST